MFPRITEVSHIKDFQLEIHFTDGAVAEIDFRKRIVGRSGFFRPLQDVDFLKQVVVDREAGTVVWPNGVDFCPEVLYAEATGISLEELGTQMELV